jgi:hypothetical protein
MRRTIIAGMMLAASMMGNAQAQGIVPPAAVSADRPALLLPADTEIWVSPRGAISSKTLRVGDTFPVAVSRDVIFGSTLVVPRGTPGTARVTWRTGKGAFGKSAKIEFEVTHLLIDGTPVPMSGRQRLAGEGNTGATIGAIVLAGVIAGALVTGRSAEAPDNAEWKVYTRAPLDASRAVASYMLGSADPYQAGRLQARAQLLAAGFEPAS